MKLIYLLFIISLYFCLNNASKIFIPKKNSETDNIIGRKLYESDNKTLKDYEEIISDEYIKAESEKENLSSMYSEMYVSLIYNNLKVKEDLENLKQTIKEYDTWLDNIDAVLNFLYSNNDKWNIKDNNILFKSNKLLAEYNELVNKVNSNKDILKEKLESIH